MTAKHPVIKRQRDRQFWQQQVEAWQQSGLRPSMYAEQHQLCKAQFERWRYRLKREANMSIAVQSEAAFIPIQVNSVSNIAPQPMVLISQNGLQLQLDVASLQNPSIILLVKELLCGR